jgi:glyoxylase-like metal-dependent hydrolase (beta-lactamase superfamily II)
MKDIIDAPHTKPADTLAQRRAAQPPQPVGSIEVYKDKRIISDGGRTLELHAFTGNPHGNPMVMAFEPKSGALFQSDLFFPGTGGGGPAAEQLLESIRKLNLPVKKMVGGHSGVGPFEEIVKATAKK